MKIAIATALKSEWDHIEKILEGSREVAACGRSFRLGKIGPNEIVLGETGIGKVNAAIGATTIIDAFMPDCFLSTGVAGGLDSSLHVMDVVAADEVVYHDVDCGPGNEYGQVQGLPPRFTCDPRLLAHAKRIEVPTEAEPAHAVAGLLASGDRFISKPQQLAVIKSRFRDALAVDMESGALAQVCHIYKLPFLSYRILSDTPHGTDRFAQYSNFWEAVAERAFAVTHEFLESLPASLDEIPLS
ncbi:MAG: 5'-methylthioadenosine/adenosylhomocysteine nucleosidase [Kiritimatiellae bacterium]|nr:5'-methylthioadenosine/adenosylhomocysteine nucleosidase [Kiritimatiellia bacterium]